MPPPYPVYPPYSAAPPLPIPPPPLGYHGVAAGGFGSRTRSLGIVGLIGLVVVGAVSVVALADERPPPE
jgi:hypothetical protein